MYMGVQGTNNLVIVNVHLLSRVAIFLRLTLIQEKPILAQVTKPMKSFLTGSNEANVSIAIFSLKNGMSLLCSRVCCIDILLLRSDICEFLCELMAYNKKGGD